MSVSWNYFLDWCGGLVMVCQHNIPHTSGKHAVNKSKCSTLSSCFLANIFMTDFKDEAIRRNLWNQNADILHFYSLATLIYFAVRLPKILELCSSSLWNLNWTTSYSFLMSRSDIIWATVLDMPATGNPSTQTQIALCCPLACNYISLQARVIWDFTFSQLSSWSFRSSWITSYWLVTVRQVAWHCVSKYLKLQGRSSLFEVRSGFPGCSMSTLFSKAVVIPT